MYLQIPCHVNLPPQLIYLLATTICIMAADHLKAQFKNTGCHV